MKNEKLTEISQVISRLDTSLDKIQSKVYKSAAHIKLAVVLGKLQSLQKDLEKQIDNERTK